LELKFEFNTKNGFRASSLSSSIEVVVGCDARRPKKRELTATFCVNCNGKTHAFSKTPKEIGHWLKARFHVERGNEVTLDPYANDNALVQLFTLFPIGK